MIRAILFATFALVLPAAAQVQPGLTGDAVVRQYVTTIEGSPQGHADRLASELPANADPVEMGNDSYMLSFAGTTPPVAIVNFLIRHVDEMSGNEFRLQRGMNISLLLAPHDDGTEMRAVIVLPRTLAGDQAVHAYHERLFGEPLQPGTEILLDGASGSGSGDLVLSNRGSPRVNADRYTSLLDSAGYSVTRQAMPGMTLIVGERTDAGLFVFVQSDPDQAGQSLVVIRSVEEQ